MKRLSLAAAVAASLFASSASIAEDAPNLEEIFMRSTAGKVT